MPGDDLPRQIVEGKEARLDDLGIRFAHDGKVRATEEDVVVGLPMMAGVDADQFQRSGFHSRFLADLAAGSKLERALGLGR